MRVSHRCLKWAKEMSEVKKGANAYVVLKSKIPLYTNFFFSLGIRVFTVFQQKNTCLYLIIWTCTHCIVTYMLYITECRG